MGFGPNWKGVGLQHTRGLLGPSVNRWSIKWSPNGTKLDRRSTGSKPRPQDKSRSNPEMFNPHTRKEGKNDHRRRSERQNANRTTGKMFGCMRWTCMQMKCTWWHDMQCMTHKKMTRQQQRITGRHLAHRSRGATTLHHYERISSRDLECHRREKEEEDEW